MKRWRWTRVDTRIPRELAAIAALVLTFFLLTGVRTPEVPDISRDSPLFAAATSPAETQPSAPVSDVSRGALTRAEANTTINVYDSALQKVVEMELEEYICGVVAAEVPAGYQVEAIKAQAVAARTYAVYDMRALGGAGCNRHADADICTSPAHCQAFAREDELQSKWGGDYQTYWGKITGAVMATQGEVAVYDGKPIHALFHAVSGGRTEDALSVFNMDLPYLTSVESIGEEGAPRYKDEISFTREQLADKLNAAYPKAKVNAGKLQGQIEVLSRFKSGQVNKVRIGSTTITGAAFRRTTGLPSANFTIGYDDKRAVFYTIGYGHGVGMSQAGANAMAQRGGDYRKILAHYYAGTQILPLSDLTR